MGFRGARGRAVQPRRKMDSSSTIDINARVQARFVNMDAAGMVSDRLTQKAIGKVYRWLRVTEGGVAARRFVENAPVFSAYVDGMAYAISPSRIIS